MTRLANIALHRLRLVVVGIVAGFTIAIVGAALLVFDRTNRDLDEMIAVHQPALAGVQGAETRLRAAKALFERNAGHSYMGLADLNAPLIAAEMRLAQVMRDIGDRQSHQQLAGLIRDFALLRQAVTAFVGQSTADVPRPDAAAAYGEVRDRLLAVRAEIRRLTIVSGGKPVSMAIGPPLGVFSMLLARYRAQERFHDHEIMPLLAAAKAELIDTAPLWADSGVVAKAEAMTTGIARLEEGVAAYYRRLRAVSDVAELREERRVIAEEWAGIEVLATQVAERLRVHITERQNVIRAWGVWGQGVLIVLVSLGTLAAIVSVLAYERVVRLRINALVAGARRFALGALDHRIDLGARDAFSLIARAFNHMARRIAASDQELQRRLRELAEAKEAVEHTNANLETIVARRTGDLQALIGELQAEAARRALIEDQLHLADTVLERALEAIMVVDRDRKVVRVNPAYMAMTGTGRDALVGTVPALLKPDGAAGAAGEIWAALSAGRGWSGELAVPQARGGVATHLVSFSQITDSAGKPSYYILIFNDISELKEKENSLSRLAFYDVLTGLPNRSLFKERLNATLQAARRDRLEAALLFIDLDKFKAVNDTLGHEAGDALLVEAARRIEACAQRETDTVARLGGDEFVVVLAGIRHEQICARVAEKLLAACAEPFALSGGAVTIGCSIGIAVYPEDGGDAEALLKHADAAMYRAKQAGRNTYVFYRKEIGNEAERRFVVERDLREALAGEHFEVYYRPVHALSSGALCGARAELFWRHPEEGLLAPTAFAGVAEETGLGRDLEALLMSLVCTQTGRWGDRFGDIPPISVGLAAMHLRRAAFASELEHCLARHGIAPGRLAIEISVAGPYGAEDELVRAVRRIADLGVPVILGGVGAGSSALGLLSRLPLSAVKIDERMVADVTDHAGSAVMVEALLHLAEALGPVPICEGVATRATAERLRSLGAELVQGPLYGAPLCAAAFEARLMAGCAAPPPATVLSFARRRGLGGEGA